MKFRPTALNDAWLIELDVHSDRRGMFARTMCADEFAKHGLCTTFVQQNLSISKHRGTIRGMHLQRPPYEEVKLVRCVKGAILDVIVDLRPTSTSFLRHEAFELSESNRYELYVPAAFAHGFQTLTDDVEVTYLMSASYVASSATGIRYNDPQLGIRWPLTVTAISEKDETWPLLGELGSDLRLQG